MPAPGRGIEFRTARERPSTRGQEASVIWRPLRHQREHGVEIGRTLKGASHGL